MGIKAARKRLDWLREQRKEVPTKFHTTSAEEFKTKIEEDLRTMLLPITFRDMYKILDGLAKPDEGEMEESKCR